MMMIQALYNKSFRMEFREDRRRKAYEENLEKIRKHNKEFESGKTSFKLAPNNLADLTNQQYLRHYVRLVNSGFDETADQDYVLGDSFDGTNYPATLGMFGCVCVGGDSHSMPVFIDWRDKGFVTKPENQKSCGSCYAFSIALSVEGQLFKKLGKTIGLR